VSWKNLVQVSPQVAGFSRGTGHHGPAPDGVVVRPLSSQWLSDEWIEETRRVWSRQYGRVISTDEAMEILMNVRRLAEVLLANEEMPRS
jgi:hypothetical protein